MIPGFRPSFRQLYRGTARLSDTPILGFGSRARSRSGSPYSRASSPAPECEPIVATLCPLSRTPSQRSRCSHSPARSSRGRSICNWVSSLNMPEDEGTSGPVGPIRQRLADRELAASERARSCNLSANAWRMIEELFHVLDAGQFGAVSREEAWLFFRSVFAEVPIDVPDIRARADSDSAIVTADEFVTFWLEVSAAGYREQDIIEEIDTLMVGASCVDGSTGSRHLDHDSSEAHASAKAFPKRPLLCRLSAQTWRRCEELFHKMSAEDPNHVITHRRAVHFFKGNFRCMSADEMFNHVGCSDGAITPEEFMAFWLQVRASGYKDRDILEEIDELMDGAAWVEWQSHTDTVHSGHVARIFPRRPFLCKLSTIAWRRCQELFSAMDRDGNLEISREEATQFFQGAFRQVSVDAMFSKMDVNCRGTISAEEFMAFWVRMRSRGCKEKDIIDEIGKMLEGSAWVDWNTGSDILPSQQPRKRQT